MQHGIDIKKIVSVSVFLCISISAIVLAFNNPSSSISLIKKVGLISTLLGAFWLIYDRYLWRYKIFRGFGWLCSVPDIEGRWEGKLKRKGTDEELKFALEVTQTFSQISYRAFSEDGEADTTTASFVRINSEWVLYSTWNSMTRNPDDQAELDRFEGASSMRIFYRDGNIFIRSNYFTNRNPRTSGELTLEHKGRKRTGAL